MDTRVCALQQKEKGRARPLKIYLFVYLTIIRKLQINL